MAVFIAERCRCVFIAGAAHIIRTLRSALIAGRAVTNGIERDAVSVAIGDVSAAAGNNPRAFFRAAGGACIFVSRICYCAVKINCRSVVVTAVEVIRMSAFGFDGIFKAAGIRISARIRIGKFRRVAFAFFIAFISVFGTGRTGINNFFNITAAGVCCVAETLVAQAVI